MKEYTVNAVTSETLTHFKKGVWYRGTGTESGIIALYQQPESNPGWWGCGLSPEEKVYSDTAMGVFCPNYFRICTPSLWEEITDQTVINKLNERLKYDKRK